MILCPVCKRTEISGEQVDLDDIFADLNQYDCPACGCFRIESDAENQALELASAQTEQLIDWIRERNDEGDIPFIKEGLLASR